MISAGSVGPSAPRLPCRYRRQRIPTFPSPTHQDRRNAPSDRSFLDARGKADLDPIIVTEGDAHSSSKREPQPPRYTICHRGQRTFGELPPGVFWNHHLSDIFQKAGYAPFSIMEIIGFRLGPEGCPEIKNFS